MRNLFLAALAGAALLASPVLAEEGAGTARSNFYLELARDQARLRSSRETFASQTGTVELLDRSPATAGRRAEPRRRAR